MKITVLSALFVLLSLSLSAQEKLKADGEFPILAWVGVPEDESTLERFKELKEAGININFVWYSNMDAVMKAMDVAQKAGVKIQFSAPELKSDPEKTVKRVMNHPALAGYHLVDEPNASQFPELSEWTKRIQAVDRKHYCYINLLPNYAALHQLGMADENLYGKASYKDYVETFVKDVPVPFVSFDHYCVVRENNVLGLRPLWYKNLEDIAAVAKAHNLPIWAFALSVAHVVYPIPTLAQLRIEMYSNLAYGAQGLQYFTYWNPGPDPTYDFHHAPIGKDKKRNDTYDLVKQMNSEIQALAGVFLGARMINVWHTGATIPEGTSRFTPDNLPSSIKSLKTSDGGAVVSLMEKGKNQFLVIVNRDFQKPMLLTTVVDDRVKRVLKDGTVVPANAYTTDMEVEPGDVYILMWKK